MLKSIALNTASAGGVRVPVNLPSMASGIWGVGDTVGVLLSEGVSVMVGESVMVGVAEIVGVSVMVGDVVGVREGVIKL